MGTAKETKADAVFQWVASHPGAMMHAALEVRHDLYGGLGLFVKGTASECSTENTSPIKETATLASSADVAQTQPVVPKDTQLFSVPRSCMLECPAGVPATLQHAALACMLLHEVAAGATSPWATYIASLPSAADMSHYMLLLWHLEDLQQQQEPQQEQQQQQQQDQGGKEHLNLGDSGTSLVQQLLAVSPAASQAFDSLCHQVMSEYRLLPSLLRSLQSSSHINFEHQSIKQETAVMMQQPCITADLGLQASTTSPQKCEDGSTSLPSLEQYIWARSIVASRAIHLWAGPTLVPLADFLNHSRPPAVVCRCYTEEPPALHGSRPKHSIYSPPSSSCSSSDSDEYDESSSGSGGADEGEIGDSCAEQQNCASRTSAASAQAQHEQATQGSSQQQQQQRRRRQQQLLQAFVCEAVHDLSAGDECLWVYNSHSHDAGWLLGYGFVPCDGTSSPELMCDGFPGVNLVADEQSQQDSHQDASAQAYCNSEETSALAMLIKASSAAAAEGGVQPTSLLSWTCNTESSSCRLGRIESTLAKISQLGTRPQARAAGIRVLLEREQEALQLS